MIRKVLVLIFLAAIVKAENTTEITGLSPDQYRNATPEAAQAALDRLRLLVADGALSQDDARKAAEDLHLVEAKAPQENVIQAPAAAPSIYQRPETSISIQISGARSDAELSELTGQLDRHGLPFLSSLQRIEIKDPPTGEDSNLGTKVVEDSRGIVTLYGHESLADHLAMGIGAHMFDYGLAPIDKSYWRENGGRADYIFAYAERLAASDNPLIPTVATAR